MNPQRLTCTFAANWWWRQAFWKFELKLRFARRQELVAFGEEEVSRWRKLLWRMFFTKNHEEHCSNVEQPRRETKLEKWFKNPQSTPALKVLWMESESGSKVRGGEENVSLGKGSRWTRFFLVGYSYARSSWLQIQITSGDHEQVGYKARARNRNNKQGTCSLRDEAMGTEWLSRPGRCTTFGMARNHDEEYELKNWRSNRLPRPALLNWTLSVVRCLVTKRIKITLFSSWRREHRGNR